ncbi:hypothetical protein N182_36845 [Sinorhizobium sp. GL2]|nr:hypothetical protein N182_36845 [Sinorhizobium sp. GL2]
MAAGIDSTGMALKKQPMQLHHSTDALGIWPGTPPVGEQNGVNPAIAAGRHVGDDRFDLFNQSPISKRRPSTGFGRDLLCTFCHV